MVTEALAEEFGAIERLHQCVWQSSRPELH